MKKILFNISNHPAREWEAKQREGWDKIIDIPFPNFSPNMSMGKVWNLGLQIRDAIYESVWDEESGYLREHPVFIMVEGEFSLTFAVTEILKRSGWFVILAFPTSERIVAPNGARQFKFSGWRYICLKQGQVLNPVLITLKDGQEFEVFARCHFAYIGRINGVTKVIFKDDPLFPEFTHPDVPDITVSDDGDIIDPFTEKKLLSITTREDGWRVVGNITGGYKDFSECPKATRFAYERALWAFFKANWEVK